MENNPKKSKAFIIAFILILLLLLIGYYLFTNRAKIFDTKGSTTISKVFAPLLGTSKHKDLTVVIDPNAKIPTTPNITPAAPSITGIVITDSLGNRIVRAEAGEDLKKGDVLYISGFNKNKDPIVMKAIASDKSKSLVFGVAGEDMLKGVMGNVIIEGILTGVPTNKKETTVWAANNPLYLSDKVYGGMTKNPPFAPSFVVPVGSVIKVDAKNGSIRIGGIITPSKINYGTSSGLGSNSGASFGTGSGTNSVFNPNINKNVLSNLKSFNSQLLNDSGTDLRGYFSSIYGADAFTNLNLSNTNGFNLNPINLPEGGDSGAGTCPTGFTGTYPNCVGPAKICPTGFTGTYPNCVGAGAGTCPTGFTGTYPNCVGPAKICPTGFTGTYPNCVGASAGTGDGNALGGPNLPAGPALPDVNLNTTPNTCSLISDNPLVFTVDEQARLNVLLRQFYLVSSTLKTAEDLTTLNNEIDQNKNFISQIEGLTNQCYKQTNDNTDYTDFCKRNPDSCNSAGAFNTNYSGPTKRHGNPWFTKTTGGSFPYASDTKGYLDYSQLEGGMTPAGYKVISGYYYGTTSDGGSCEQYNNFPGYGLSDQISNKKDIYTGRYCTHYNNSNSVANYLPIATIFLNRDCDEWESYGGGFPGDSLTSYYARDNAPSGSESKDPQLDKAFPRKEILEAGCSWKDGVILDNTERILNIW